MDGRQTDGWTVRWWGVGDERRKWKRSDWLRLNCGVTCAPGILILRLQPVDQSEFQPRWGGKRLRWRKRATKAEPRAGNRKKRSCTYSFFSLLNFLKYVKRMAPPCTHRAVITSCRPSQTTFFSKRTKRYFQHIKRNRLLLPQPQINHQNMQKKLCDFSLIWGCHSLMCTMCWLQSHKCADKSANYYVFTRWNYNISYLSCRLQFAKWDP